MAGSVNTLLHSGGVCVTVNLKEGKCIGVKKFDAERRLVMRFLFFGGVFFYQELCLCVKSEGKKIRSVKHTEKMAVCWKGMRERK